MPWNWTSYLDRYGQVQPEMMLMICLWEYKIAAQQQQSPISIPQVLMRPGVSVGPGPDSVQAPHSLSFLTGLTIQWSPSHTTSRVSPKSPQSMTLAELSPHRLVTLTLSARLESHPRKALQAPSVLQHTYSRSCLCAAHPVCATRSD